MQKCQSNRFRILKRSNEISFYNFVTEKIRKMLSIQLVPALQFNV